ncbi:MAG: hypothetical protein ACRDJ9_01915 [Dehalococcoidia bacterium]
MLRGAPLVSGAGAVDRPIKPVAPMARIMKNPPLDTAQRDP